MAKNSNKALKEAEQIQQEAVAEKVSAVEKFFNENKKIIWGVLCAILVIGLGVLAYQKFILQPAKAEAKAQMFPAEENFRNGEYDLALNGDGNVAGFAQVIEDYGSKAGASVYFYAGVCELQLGNFQSAVDYLKKYNGNDAILAARALGCEGDAYAGLEDYKSAVACFEKAAAKADNIFAASYLLKAGVVYEEMGDSAKALACYNKIKDQYPQSMEAYEIEKYISRITYAK